MQQHGKSYFARRPTDPNHSTLGLGSKGQNSTFSEYGHVAYQIKWNRECSNMQAHIQSLHTPSTPGMVSKVKTHICFLKVVMLHIKLKGMENRANRGKLT